MPELETVSRSPLLQAILARQVQQPIRNPSPIGAALEAAAKVVNARTLRKGEKERVENSATATEGLISAMSSQEPVQADISGPDGLRGLAPEVSAISLQQALSAPDLDPSLRNAVMQQMFKGQKQKDFTLAPGAQRFDPQGNLIVENKKADGGTIGKVNPEKFTPDSVEKFRKTQDYSSLVLADVVQKTQEIPPPIRFLTTEEKADLGLNPLSQFQVTKDNGLKEFKPSNTTDSFKFSQLTLARQNWERVEDMLFEKGEDGTVNYGRFKRGMQQLFGAEGGRQVKSLTLQVLDTYLRGTSGAAVPETEVERGKQMFVPHAFDSQEAALLKMEIMRDFLGGVYDVIVPPDATPEQRLTAQRQMLDAAEHDLAKGLQDIGKPTTSLSPEEVQRRKELKEKYNVGR